MSAAVSEASNSDVDTPAPQMARRSKRMSALVRSVLAFGFVFATLAAGHLFMVAINAFDHAVSGAEYKTNGVEARWFGDRSILAKLNALEHEASTDAARHTIDEAIQTVRDGRALSFYMLPVSSFLVAATFALILAGFVLLILSRYAANNAMQSVIGIFAGLLLWTGGAEYGLMVASRLLGVAKAFDLHGDRLVGAFGEYVLLKHTWGLILLVVMYLLFLETNRCPFFLWFRRRLHLMRGALATGRIDNFAPRTAFQYVTVMWVFYVLLLWAYDEAVFGVDSWFTRAIFFGSFASTGYLWLRLFRQGSMGRAIRYAIATSIVSWNSVEIAAKWGLFREPWLILNPVTVVVFFGAAALGAWLVVRELRRDAFKEIAAEQ